MIGPLALMLGTAMIVLALIFFAKKRFKEDPDALEQVILQTLPQTQCAQCGYPGCRPYAQAIAAGEAINRCPPGGDALIEALAELLNRDIEPLAEGLKAVPTPLKARIREEDCIGCTLCIKACPVDAIVGSKNLMHSVINSNCTGCELCLPPCPVDCIDLVAQIDIAREKPRPAFPTPCIFCGACEPVCPKDLAPHVLLLAFHQPEAQRTAQLSNCIECTLCDQVCPSEIPLTQTFQSMKHNSRLRSEQKDFAEVTEQRYRAREGRLKTVEQTVINRPKADAAMSLINQIKRDFTE
jgi:electron transport complex protein RnfB